MAKKVLMHGSMKKDKRFVCHKCHCKYISDDWYEEFGLTKDFCPECGSQDISEDFSTIPNKGDSIDSQEWFDCNQGT